MGDVLTGTLSFLLLLVASKCVGDGGEILGEHYDASIIGGLVIAWLNTAPETIFFITALEGNNPSFAVGAMAGSVIVVSTVALGACIILGSLARRTRFRDSFFFFFFFFFFSKKKKKKIKEKKKNCLATNTNQLENQPTIHKLTQTHTNLHTFTPPPTPPSASIAH
jgi:Ca2+/Na+ antiporter